MYASCWLWSLIFQIQRYYSVVIVTHEYCTLIPPALGFGEVPRKRGLEGRSLERWGFGGSALEKWGFGGGAPEIFFWDVCWPIVLRTHGIGLTIEFSHCISPIKESIVK